VQDRYAGDVGDFMKLGLLRCLASSDISLGINWYLVPDEAHNADGKHIAYLSRSNKIGRGLEPCDPILYSELRELIESQQRSVAALEVAGVLPQDTKTFDVPLSRGMTISQRLAWHHEAMSTLHDRDLVFLDPDNGIRVDPGPRLEKFALTNEISDYFAAGSTVVVYHHADRSKGGVPAQLKRRMEEIGKATGSEMCGAVVARRGSCRFFLIAAQHAHRDTLALRLSDYSIRWKGHAQVSFDSPAREAVRS